MFLFGIYLHVFPLFLHVFEDYVLVCVFLPYCCHLWLLARLSSHPLPEVRQKLRNVDRIQADVVGMVCPKLQPPSGTGEISGVVLLVAALCDEEGDDGLTLCE